MWPFSWFKARKDRKERESSLEIVSDYKSPCDCCKSTKSKAGLVGGKVIAPRPWPKPPPPPAPPKPKVRPGPQPRSNSYTQSGRSSNFSDDGVDVIDLVIADAICDAILDD